MEAFHQVDADDALHIGFADQRHVGDAGADIGECLTAQADGRYDDGIAFMLAIDADDPTPRRRKRAQLR